MVSDGRQHHDELTREFALMSVAARAGESRVGVPQRLVELTHELGVRYASASTRPDEEIDAAIERGDATVDLVYQVPTHVIEAADQLESLLAEADEFCRSEQLLTLARSDLQVQFAHWYLEEFRRQFAGEAPQPWDGPLRP